MRKLIILSFVTACIAVFFVFVPLDTEARGLVPCGGCSTDLDPVTAECPLDEDEPPCSLCHILVVIQSIIKYLLVPTALNSNIPLIPLLAALLIAVGGFLFFTSAGNPQQLDRARTILKAVFIGLLIIYGSWVLINTLLSFLGATRWTGTGDWWEIQCGSIPIVTLTTLPSTVFFADSTELIWETSGVSSCNASGDWSGTKETSCDPTCSETFTPLALGSYTFKIKCTGLAGVVTSSALIDVVPYIYEASSDFAEGDGINTDDSEDKVKLAGAIQTLNFIWVAASGRGTILKVDTETGEILGEYASAPDGRGKSPSRTTVDNNGNVWAGNRLEAGVVSANAIAPGTPATDSEMGSIVHIGLPDNGQCQDRHGPLITDPPDGIIQTSTELGDVLTWSNAGGADTLGGVSTAYDECIIDYIRVYGRGIRAVSVDAANNVWAGSHNANSFSYVDESTGSILTFFNVGCGGYGSLVDANNVLWSSGRTSPLSLLRYDTNDTPIDTSDDTFACIPVVGSYGLGIDSSGNVWHDQWDVSEVWKFNPDGVLLGKFPAGTGGASGTPLAPDFAGGARGLVLGSDDNAWIANSRNSTVTRLDNDGNFIASVPVGANPTGVALDKNDLIWVINQGSDDATHIDPATNSVIKTVFLGAGSDPYNYSDMTGSTLTGAPLEGTWSVVQDSNVAGAKWGQVTWTSLEPNDSFLEVRVSVSEDGSTFSAPQLVSSGTPFNVTGRYLKVIVSFHRATTGESPELLDLQLTRTPPS